MAASSRLIVILALAASIICTSASSAPYGNFSTSPSFKAKVRGKHTTTLSPVPKPQAEPKSHQSLLPTKQVSLNWGTQGNPLVNVSLSMKHPAVLLEEIDNIRTVDCELTSVIITFREADSFNRAAADWSGNGHFILVTNHLGDCDAENERGIFLAKKISAHQGNFTIVASGEKTDINNAAESTEITFFSVPVSSSKRGITWDDDELTLSNNLSLPADTLLFKEDPYLSVTADNADLSTLVTVSGKLRYSLLHAQLQELSVDIDGSAEANLGLTVEVKAPYNHTFSYNPTPLTYSLINVPGIISLGPALSFHLGADVDAQAGVSITTEFSSKIENGKFHIDFLDNSASSATGLTPTFNAVTNITEKVAVSIDPFVDITVELAFLLLGGLVDLSGGITAQPRFNNDFVLSATQSFEQGDTIAEPQSDGCTQGLLIKSEFQVSVIAFVTQWWKTTVYNVEKPITNECYSWL